MNVLQTNGHVPHDLFFFFRATGVGIGAACLAVAVAGALIIRAPPDEAEGPPDTVAGVAARDDSAPVDFSFDTLLPSRLNLSR